MKKILLYLVVPLAAVAAIVGLDQWSKYLTIKYIPLGSSIVLIDSVFELLHIRNEGMAWGMLQNKQWLFIIMTPIVLGLIAYFYARMPHEKKFIQVRIAEIMLAGGAIGNLVDRLFRGDVFGKGNVVDMFYVKAINFPVFNVADSFVTVSFLWLLILLLFVYKEEDFDKIINLPFKKKKVQDKE